MDIKKGIQDTLKESSQVKLDLMKDDHFLSSLEILIRELVALYREEGGCFFLAGNGGSAADAQHIAAELVGRFILDRPGLNAEALTVDTSILTSISNDFGYEEVYRRQLEGKARKGDIFMAISTSGNSANLLKAMEYCRNKGIKTVALTGKEGGKMAALADILINVPYPHTPRIQESHITIGHIICDLVEQELQR